MKIYGNKVGGSSVADKNYLIESNGLEFWGVIVDDENIPDPTACCQDVMAGQWFLGANGLEQGTNDSPCCRVTSGVHEVAPGIEFVLRIEKCEQWDYSLFHGVITQKSSPNKIEKLIKDDVVYDLNGEKISDITKDHANCAIRFNIKNNSAEPQLLHFFICKEERI